MKLQAALGASLAWVGGALSDIEMAWTRALRLAETLGDVDHQLRSLWGLWLLNERDALPLARRLFAVAATPAAQLLGERMIAVSSHYLGDQTTARHHIERVIANDGMDDTGWRIIRFQIAQRSGARDRRSPGVCCVGQVRPMAIWFPSFRSGIKWLRSTTRPAGATMSRQSPGLTQGTSRIIHDLPYRGRQRRSAHHDFAPRADASLPAAVGMTPH